MKRNLFGCGILILLLIMLTACDKQESVLNNGVEKEVVFDVATTTVASEVTVEKKENENMEIIKMLRESGSPAFSFSGTNDVHIYIEEHNEKIFVWAVYKTGEVDKLFESRFDKRVRLVNDTSRNNILFIGLDQLIEIRLSGNRRIETKEYPVKGLLEHFIAVNTYRFDPLNQLLFGLTEEKGKSQIIVFDLISAQRHDIQPKASFNPNYLYHKETGWLIYETFSDEDGYKSPMALCMENVVTGESRIVTVLNVDTFNLSISNKNILEFNYHGARVELPLKEEMSQQYFSENLVDLIPLKWSQNFNGITTENKSIKGGGQFYDIRVGDSLYDLVNLWGIPNVITSSVDDIENGIVASFYIDLFQVKVGFDANFKSTSFTVNQMDRSIPSGQSEGFTNVKNDDLLDDDGNIILCAYQNGEYLIEKSTNELVFRATVGSTMKHLKRSKVALTDFSINYQVNEAILVNMAWYNPWNKDVTNVIHEELEEVVTDYYPSDTMMAEIPSQLVLRVKNPEPLPVQLIEHASSYAEYPLTSEHLRYPLVIFDQVSNTELATVWYLISDREEPLQVLYNDLNVKYEDQHVVFRDYLTYNTINLQDDLFASKRTLAGIWSDNEVIQEMTTPDAQTLIAGSSIYYTLVFNSQTGNYERYNVAYKDYMQGNFNALPVEVEPEKKTVNISDYQYAKDEAASNRVALTPLFDNSTLASLYLGMSADKIIKLFGVPNEIGYFAGTQTLKYEEVEFLLSYPISSRKTLGNLVGLIYSGDDSVNGLKPGDGIKTIYDELAYLPNIQEDIGSEWYTLWFTTFEDDMEIQYNLNEDLSVYDVLVTKKSGLHTDESSTSNVYNRKNGISYKDEMTYNYPGLNVEASVFVDEFGGWLFYTADDGLYYFDGHMVVPAKVCDENIVVIEHIYMNMTPNIIYGIGIETGRLLKINLLEEKSEVLIDNNLFIQD